MRKAAVLLYSLTLAHGLSFPWSAKNDASEYLPPISMGPLRLTGDTGKEGRRCTLDVLVIDKANHIFRFNIKHPSGGSQRVGGYTDDNTHRIRKRDINYEGAVQRPMPGNVVDAQTGVGYGGALDGSSNEVHKPQKVPGDGFNTERESYGVGNREYSEKQQFAPGGPANETPSVENEPVSERAMDPRYRGSEGYDRGGYEGRDSPPPRYQGYQEYPPQDRSYGAVPRGDQRYRREQYGNESERRDQYPIHNPQDDRQYPSTRQDDAETVRLVFKASQDWDEVSVVCTPKTPNHARTAYLPLCLSA
jgi:hypothetical protein